MQSFELIASPEDKYCSAKSGVTFQILGSHSDNKEHPHEIAEFKSNPECCLFGERFGEHLHLVPNSWLPSRGLMGTEQVTIGERVMVNGVEYMVTENVDSDGELFGDPVLVKNE